MPAALPPLVLDVEQKQELESILRRRTESAALVQRVRIILLAAAGHSHRRIGQEVSLKAEQVSVWRKRFEAGGMASLRDRTRSGRPPTMTMEQRRKICETACRKPPQHLSRWSISSLARYLKMPRNRIERALAEAHLHPHRLRTFTFSPDPNFGEKLLDVVALYMAAFGKCRGAVCG